MATLKCPTNVTSITFATSGALVPDGSNNVTGITPDELTAMTRAFGGQGSKHGVAKLISTAANGDVVVSLPEAITAITIGGVAYDVNGVITPWGKVLSAAVPAPAASVFLYQNFSLVQG
jgi:hypothetical protein